ncbi:MAG: hypothetical protein ABH872_05770 [Candidatus Omnitrophota bacterium]
MKRNSFIFIKKSLTLVELFVAIAALMVILLGIAGSIAYNVKLFRIHQAKVSQYLDLTYARQFIQNKVSNSTHVSLEDNLGGDKYASAVLSPYDSAQPKEKIYLDSASHVLYYCPDAANLGSCEVITENISRIDFCNPKEPLKISNFKLLAFDITKEPSGYKEITSLIISSSVYAKLQAPSIVRCWVADTGNNQVVKLDEDGTVLLRIGGFNNPWAVSVDPNNGDCWVADTGNNEIVKLSPDGGVIFRLSGFNNVRSLKVNISTGECWVGEHRGNGRIVKLSQDGGLLFETGGYQNITSLSVNPTNNDCWVTHGGFTLTKVNELGAVVFNRQLMNCSSQAAAVNPNTNAAWWGWMRKPPNMALPWKIYKVSNGGGIAGTTIDGVTFCTALSVNSKTNEFWALDDDPWKGDSIHKLNSNGQVIFTKKSVSLANYSQDGELSVVSDNGDCWVADTGNNEVVKLAGDGTELFRVRGFNQPQGISAAIVRE